MSPALLESMRGLAFTIVGVTIVYVLVQITKALRELVSLVGIARAEARDADNVIASHAATSPHWPPPYASNKGMTQDLDIEGFALTHGNKTAFVHMKPITQWGDAAYYDAMKGLRWRLMLAVDRLDARLLNLDLAKARARIEKDPNDRDAQKLFEALMDELRAKADVQDDDDLEELSKLKGKGSEP